VNELLAELLKMARSEDREKAEGIVTKIKGKVTTLDEEVTANTINDVGRCVSLRLVLR
jgi:hypothetical protein